jgi:hypothetical protein
VHGPGVPLSTAVLAGSLSTLVCRRASATQRPLLQPSAGRGSGRRHGRAGGVGEELALIQRGVDAVALHELSMSALLDQPPRASETNETRELSAGERYAGASARWISVAPAFGNALSRSPVPRTAPGATASLRCRELHSGATCIEGLTEKATARPLRNGHEALIGSSGGDRLRPRTPEPPFSTARGHNERQPGDLRR